MKLRQLTPTLLLTVFLAGCGKPKQVASSTPPEVTVSHPSEERVADYLDLTGTVAPSQSVDLVARVSGYLLKADFDEGTVVDAGKVLFLIEPDTYKQQLLLAEAALLRARSEYERQDELLKQNATSTANQEKWLSERDQAAAQVELAKLNLSYTKVTAPFTGRIGRRLVDPGNLVGPSVNTKLATLDQIAPIYVNFSLNERDLLRVREAMRARGIVGKPDYGRAVVLVGLQNEEGHPHQGVLDFVDTGLDTASGTMSLRAIFKNEERKLLPGLFARVRIPFAEPRPMFVVPNSAVGNDQEGDYVLVLDANGLVARRAVVKGPLLGTGCAIRSGLTAADNVIVNGQTRARPGAKVTPVTAATGSNAPAGPAK
jgi:RND family efflux transporter MFP subunit